MNKSDSFGISEDQTLLFSDIQGQKKKRAVNCFYHVLVLATRDYINVEQDAPYCEIRIRKGVNFDQENDQMSMSQQ
jgi:chromatin segregation and condensation protein Rec8/ScpA/Scc1 (kleisin family)